MTNLEKNINQYMELKGIRFYTDLLVDIAHQLNIKGYDAFEFANREKANFSKMLKGQRPLKYDFIVPLEKIFGVSLARLLDEDAYKLPTEKDNIPFLKGFRYYAYKDDPELYEKELDNLLTATGESCLTQTDEFGKTFLDYAVEYKSINGVRFLHDKYKLKLRSYNNHFETEPNGILWIHNKGIELARMISNFGDVELFNDIYDSRYMVACGGYYLPDTIFATDEYASIILENKELYNSLFENKPYAYLYGRKAQTRLNKKYMEFNSINPVINTCLSYALRHLKKYKNEAIEILNFGINHNLRIRQRFGKELYNFHIDECGGIRDRANNNEIVQIAVIVKEKEINDEEINNLIEQLPTFM